MSNVNIASEMSRESVHGLSKLKQQKQEQQQQVVQEQSLTTGIQWTQNTQTTQAVQASAQNSQAQAADNKQNAPKIVAPGIEDLATLTTTVSTNTTTTASVHRSTALLSRFAGYINVDEIKKKYREIYRSTRSHNLLYERLMNNFKAAGVQALLGLLGADPSEISNIQSEVREEALKEIDQRLAIDWAQAKATIEIVG